MKPSREYREYAAEMQAISDFFKDERRFEAALRYANVAQDYVWMANCVEKMEARQASNATTPLAALLGAPLVPSGAF